MAPGTPVYLMTECINGGHGVYCSMGSPSQEPRLFLLDSGSTEFAIIGTQYDGTIDTSLRTTNYSTTVQYVGDEGWTGAVAVSRITFDTTLLTDQRTSVTLAYKPFVEFVCQDINPFGVNAVGIFGLQFQYTMAVVHSNDTFIQPTNGG